MEKIMNKQPAQVNNNQNEDSLKFQTEMWLTVSQAAELLNVSSSSLRRLETAGRITSIRRDNGYRFFKENEVVTLRDELKRGHEVNVKKTLQLYHTQPTAKINAPEVKVVILHEGNKNQEITNANPKIQLELPFNKEFMSRVKKAMAPEYMLIMFAVFLGGFLLNSAQSYVKDRNTDKEVKGSNTRTAYYNADGTEIKDKTNSDILGIRDRLTNFVFNINVPTNIKSNLTVDGITNTTQLAFQGAASILGLRGIDDVTKATLEEALEIDGDVIGTLNKVVIADKVIKPEHLSDALVYGGDWDFTGTWAIDGTEITITGEQLNSYAEASDNLFLVAENADALITLSESQVASGGVPFGDGSKFIQDTVNFVWDDTNNRLGVGTNSPLYTIDVNGSLNTTNLLLGGTSVTASAAEINYLTGTTVQEGGIVFGDGTKLTQDTSSFYWQATDNRLGIGTTNPLYSLDVNGASRFADNVIIGGTQVSLTGASSTFVQTQNGANLEFRTATEGEIKLIAGSNALIALTPSNEKVYIEGNGLIVGEAGHLFTADTVNNIVQIGTNVYNDNLLNVAGSIGMGDYLFLGNTSGGIDLDTSYGIRSNGGTIQVKNINGVWNDVAVAGGLSPDGTNGAVQFTDGTNFVADSTNFVWNNTGKYLTLNALRGIGATNPINITDYNGTGGVTVKAGGLVGISNTNPVYPLDVTGGISTSTDLYIAGVGLGSTALASGSTRIGIDYGSLSNALTATNVQEALAALDSVVGASAGDIQSVGSISTGLAFSSVATADGQWLGLGSADGRIAFSTAPGNSQIHFLDANIGIGTTNAGSKLDVNGDIRGTRFAFTNDTNNYFEYLGVDKVGIGTSGQTRFTIDGTGKVGIGTTAPDAALTIQPTNGTALNIKNYGASAGQTGELRFYATDGTYMGFKAPDSAPTNQIYILPPVDGLTNQVLTTDGTGTLTWQTAAGVGTTAAGDITTVGSMVAGDAFSNTGADGQWLGLGAGAGRMYFADDTTDEISILNANFGIGKTNPTVALDVNGAITSNGTVTGTALTDGTATLTLGSISNLSNITMSGTLDMGTNTIYDGNLTGSWAFNSGNITGINNLTVDGIVTLSSPNTGTDNTVMILNSSNQIVTDEIDSRVWDTTLTDGSGISNYLSKWFDGNTLANSLVYDNGSFVGIGNTNPTTALDVTGTIKGTSLTDGTATVTAGSATGLVNITASGAISFSGIGATNTGDNVVVKATDGKLNTRAIDTRAWGTTLTDGSGISNYISRWLDANTLGTGVIYDSGTNVGIGNTNNTYKLDVTGNVRISSLAAGASNTVLTHASGVLETRTIDSRVWGSSLTDGTGTSNYMSRWLDANTLANGILFDNGTNIGLGNTNPNYKLDVTGDIYSSANIRANTEIFKGSIGLGATGSSNSTAGAYVIGTFDEFSYSNSSNVQDVLDDLDNQLSAAVGSSLSGTGPANYITKYSAIANTIVQSNIFDNGTNIGIGNTNPTTALDVTGTIKGTSLTDGTATITSGNATGLGNITASGTISFSGIGATNTGDNIVVKATDGTLNTRAIDTRVWGTTLTDGSGISNYISRWLDSNTFGTGSIYDNGTSIGIGTTGLTSALNITPSTEAGIQLNPAGGTVSQLRFLDADSSLYAAFRSPSVLDEDTIYTLPTNNGNSNEVLVSDGNGNLSWASVTGVGAGVGSITAVGNVTTGTAFGSVASADGKWLGLGAADGRIAFSTAPGNSQIHMLDARVGIGTTNAAEKLEVVGNFMLSGTAFITTLDLGTNVISDGQLNGNWNFNGGAASSLSSVGTTSLTASGAVTFTGLGSTNTGTNVLVVDAAGNIKYTNVLTDGTGISNYTARWLDSNTLGTGLLSDNGTNVGIGNTNNTYAFDVTGDIYSSANIRANTEIFKGSIGLGATGSSSTTSGAYVIGAFDEFTYSNSTTVQDVLDDLDNQIGLIGGSSISGTGPTNYLTKYGTISGIIEASNVFDDGTNVGIGNTNPTTKLDVTGTIKGTTLSDGTATLTSGTLDLGTNTISDGQLNGNWNFNGGSATSLSSVGTTSLTASGSVTLSGIGSTDNGNNILMVDGAGKLDYRTIDSRVWNSTLTDGTGTSNYITRWLDGNTLGTGLIYDNGSNVGIGKTNPGVALDVNGAISSSATVTGTSLTDGTATLTSGSLSNASNITMSGTLDLGTNTISDGQLNGNWNFNGGSATSLSAVGTTSLTASGSVTLSGIGSTDNGNNVLVVSGTGKVDYRAIDSRAWGTTLADGSGISNYITRWLDANTIGTGVIFDNGTFVGIGKTNPTVALDVVGAITSTGTVTGTTLTDGTATLTSGTLNNIVNINMSGAIDLGVNTIDDAVLTGNWNFSGGAASSLSSVGTTSLTASSTVTFTGLGTGTDNTVLILNASNQVTTAEIDPRTWGSTLADGSGASNYITRWLDGNTIGTGLIYDNTTNVGIGNTNPQYKLDVNGNARIATLATGATDTVVTQASGVLETRTIDSRVWGSTIADGSGISGYLSKWLDGNTVGNGLVYDTGTFVGIGKTNPGVALDVNGAITASTTITGATLTDGTATLNTGSFTGVNNINMSGAIDLGVNTIDDAVLTGNWNFSGGSATSLASVGTTSLTASGAVTLSGIGSTNNGDNILVVSGTGKVDFRAIDSRTWGSTLTDGSGVSSYIARWLDGNTIGTGIIWDNSTYVGIGTTSTTAKVEIETTTTENRVSLLLDQNDATNNPKVLQIENGGTGDAIYVDAGEFVVDSTGNVTSTGTTGITLNSAADLTIGTLGIRDTGSSQSTSGAYLIGFYGTGNTYATGDDVQEAIKQLDSTLGSALTGIITGVGSMGSGDVFANSSANGQWLGLGSTEGRIYFADDTIDEISILDAYLGLGLTNPLNRLDINGGAVLGAGYAGISTAPTNGMLIQGSLGLGTSSPLNKLDVSGSAVIGASYAGLRTAPANGLLVQGVLGVGTTSITTGFEAFINGDFGIAQGAYLNIGTTYGASGYGLRDNGGVIEAKDLGGNWVELVGGGYWNLIGNSAPTSTIAMDQNYAYNLGIGTTAAQERLHVVGNILLSGTAFAGTVDLGTNVITDGNFNGVNWSFNSGNLASIGNLATTGNVTFTGLGSTNVSNNVLVVDASGNLKYTNILTDGSGVSNYNTRWLDGNTLTTGSIYDNGTNVGIGTTNMSYRLNVAGTTMHQDTVYFANGSTYYVDSSGNAKFHNIISDDTTNPGISVGNGATGSIKLGSATLRDDATTYLSLDTNSDTTDEVRVYDNGNLWSRTGNFTSDVLTSSTSVGFTLNTNNTLSTQGSKLLSVANNGAEKMYLDANGNLFVSGTVTAGNGASMLLTNKSGTEVANRSLVVLDPANNSSFTTTTTPYSKQGYGVVLGVGVGTTNDIDGDGLCDNNDICMVAYGGEVEVKVKNASVASKGEYLFTSDTAGSAVASAKQFDGLLGVISNTAGSGSGYVKMIFHSQPQVTAAAAMDSNSKHNDYWLFANQYSQVGEGSGLDLNMIARGLSFDTLDDSTKIDSTNTTVSVNTYDNRAGLVGGQQFTQGTTDTYGNTLLGSTAVNDMFFYDRTVKDSKPEVQVELGIDPNWFNGVTLTTIDSTTNPTAARNTNLSTTYNGSLVKATGTYASSPATIYLTIKSSGTSTTSPATFDWTDNAGAGATNVSMTPGVAQALASTGVSVTFTNTEYNVGDVFRVASWYTEPASATRGTRQQFPERTILIATNAGVDIMDADTQKLWMRFSQSSGYALGADANNDPSAIQALNGVIYVSNNGSSGIGLQHFAFNIDATKSTQTAAQYISNSISRRNTVMGYTTYSIPTVISNVANDVAAAVIPNQPTQEVTVNGWGYIIGNDTTNIFEAVTLPYTFDQTPNITVSYASASSSVVPTSLTSCNLTHTAGTTITANTTGVEQDNFNVAFRRSDAATFTSTAYYCYTWTATGIVSPKQFVAVATGATGTDGGTTIINETDGTTSAAMVGSQSANILWSSRVSLNTNTLYIGASDASANSSTLSVYYGIHGSQTDTTWAQYRNGAYPITPGSSWGANGPSILGSTTGTEQIKSLTTTNNTSTIDATSNTIYVGTSTGVSVIQEKQGHGNISDGLEESSGSIKYYTKDYISEEMVGDIRGMWPLNADNTASDLEDISVKANTLTGTNITAADSAPGVRGMAYDFDGSTEFLNRNTDTDFDISGNLSFGTWIKTTDTSAYLFDRWGSTGVSCASPGTVDTSALYRVGIASGTILLEVQDNTDFTSQSLAANKYISDNQWHHIVTNINKSGTLEIYIDGNLEASAVSTETGTYTFDDGIYLGVHCGSASALSNYYSGSMDEPFVTATAISADKIKNMYEVGYRALQSHTTNLGSGTADGNQKLGFAGVGTSAIGVVAPDWNNQYMYVGINNTTLGGLSKIDLSSDTNVKTYTSSANVPSGGTLLLDEDVNSLAVGYKLEAVGSAAKGITTTGWDGYAQSTSGNLVGKTITTVESFNQAYLWAQYVTDSSDSSNTVNVWASNDGGSNYYLCSITNTDTTTTPTEYEYFCPFPTDGNSLKTKFVINRGSTKTNTYIHRYGIAWIDSNNTATVSNASGFYTNTGTVSDGSYLQVTHNQNTNDILATAWLNTGTKWEQIDGSYKPAISWEGKDGQRTNYHQEASIYSMVGESLASTENLVSQGMLFDTFEDSTKTDSASNTVSSDNQSNDTGTTEQQGRVGLVGGQQFTQGTTDTYGNTLLGSTAVNDMFFYDRTVKDSSPEVQVELGIDPNWFNGVTLTTIDSTTNPSPARNTNLSTTYNGSLVKATGTYASSPATIYLTIKSSGTSTTSPATFDWTDNAGASGTAVAMTPGVAQALASTGVSVTFTNTEYNVGDVFRVASWYTEPASATRGTRQQFPERSNLIITSGSANTNYLHIVDVDTQKLWMRFVTSAGNIIYSRVGGVDTLTSVTALNGNIYTGDTYDSTNGSSMASILFSKDTGINYGTVALFGGTGKVKYKGNIAQRNGGKGHTSYGATSLVTGFINDVAAAVIPDQPTQEVTVSGWGAILITNPATTGNESITLPYKFNDNPNISISSAGFSASAPTTLASCTATVNTFSTGVITKNSFTAQTWADGGAFGTGYYCYTWTATGIVSPKQFVAVATGTSGADGGTTIINETDGTNADLGVGSLDAGFIINQTKVALANNAIYTANNDFSGNITRLNVQYGVHGIQSDTSLHTYRNGSYKVGTQDSWMLAILGVSAGTEQIKSLSVTAKTSAINKDSNTIYVGTTKGVSVIQENQGHSTTTDGAIESSGSIKYYTKDYISEEMIGDIRGMWPLNADNTSSDLEDVSIKANTLTGINITAADSAPGVRGMAYNFDGSTEYLSCTDASCGGTSKLDLTEKFSFGAWINPTNTSAGTRVIITKEGATNGYFLYQTGANIYTGFGNGSGFQSQTSTTSPLVAGVWSHVIITWNGTTLSTYVNGVLIQSETKTGNPTDSTGDFYIGSLGSIPSQFFTGIIDEPFVTASTISADKVKNMYEVGYRALQSHTTNLGSGTADGNQKLGFISTGTTSIGVVAPDWNNQYMYVGINSTTLGGLSKIDLSSDTNVKTYTSSANGPAGGTLLLDEDITSLAVGYNLEAVGSAAKGITTTGWDGYSTATTGNFVGKTYALPKNIGSAVLWVSPVLDLSDVSNSIAVKASNDGGSNYVTCTLITTDNNQSVPEKEYACNFATSDNDLKVKFEFTRGSTKTNTYVTQYGISWLGETGFKIEQTDTNNVRLYNYTGESRELRLDVVAGASNSNSGNISLAPLAADVDAQDNSNSIWINKTGTGGNLLKLQTSGTDVLSLTSAGTMTLTGNLTTNKLTTTDFVLGSQSIAPTSPTNGQIYYNSTEKETYIYKNDQWTKFMTEDAGSCPTGYVLVPGSTEFGTQDFCVMKYEAKLSSTKLPISVAGTAPWVNVDWYEAKAACERAGAHLITNAEWMTIARNIEATTINDLDADAGLQLATGHSDNAPASAADTLTGADPVVSGCNLSANMEDAANAYSAGTCEIRGDGSYAGDANDKGYYATSQAWATTGYSAGAANKSQLRTNVLSNGQVIWDVSGNIWEWSDWQCGTSVWNTNAGWLEWNNAGLTDYEKYAGGPNGSLTSANGAGQYYGCTAAGNAALRGGGWSNTAVTGPFTLALNSTTSGADTYVGFRCVQ